MRHLPIASMAFALFLSACGGSSGASQDNAAAVLPPGPPEVVSKLAGVWAPPALHSDDQVEFSASGELVDGYENDVAAGLQFEEVRPGQFEATEPDGRVVLMLVNLETERHALMLWGPYEGTALERAPLPEVVRPVSDDLLRETRWYGRVTKVVAGALAETTNVSLWINDDMSFSLVYDDERVFKVASNRFPVFAPVPDRSRVFLASHNNYDGDNHTIAMILSDDEMGLTGIVEQEDGDQVIEYWTLSPEAE